MKKVLILLFIVTTGVTYGQITPTSFDTTAYDLPHLKENCISISDEQLHDNPDEKCRVSSVDSIFTNDNNTWYLAYYWYSGVFGDIQNRNTMSDDLKKRQYDYQAVVLFVKKTSSDVMRANFIIVKDPYDANQIRDPEFNISAEGPLLKLTYFHLGDYKYYEYYLFSENNWTKINSELWKERIDKFLPEGYYYYPIMSISVYSLSSSSYVFDREWLGSGDQLRDAEKLGEINLKLAIEDQQFVIDRFSFVRYTEE